ncbi:MAG: superoxide dismutase [Chloroflexaceae bacterium]|nr:superoxide dismutase [Chloroflexaceae bacterium]
MGLNRRQLLYLLGASGGAVALGTLPQQAKAQSAPAAEGPHTLAPLPYAYEALEPYIDAETMRFHHDKHHAGYVRNLNAAINKYPNLRNQSPEDLVRNLDSLPEDIRQTVRNNGGGHVNHTMFWQIMAPNAGGKPTGELARAIDSSFGSFEAFQEKFNQAGSGRFGSGWAWLVLEGDKLAVTSTLNQDSPWMSAMVPIMGNDVWEHAYYLKYRNDRGAYLKQWWNVVNWPEVNKRFLQARGR